MCMSCFACTMPNNASGTSFPALFNHCHALWVLLSYVFVYIVKCKQLSSHSPKS